MTVEKKEPKKVEEQLLTITELAKLFSFSVAHTKRYIITQPDFPSPVRLTDKGTPRYKRSEILLFIDTRKDY